MTLVGEWGGVSLILLQVIGRMEQERGQKLAKLLSDQVRSLDPSSYPSAHWLRLLSSPIPSSEVLSDLIRAGHPLDKTLSLRLMRSDTS